ncbi:hypothetical protein D0T12_19095 [Actinomadura spongiicola]|uniref:Uncharacterized protein n=1 Tax=Actinomadura spongiicola TaxID=2303421 RepID=A0A372GGD6_9ACTN|nr:hypothetical protein [Actinomadura spongiicola]RFS84242.1 hypothetical protein D0T12_19095 [Actinomadura spongiicola]
MATEIVAPPRPRLTTQLLLVCGGAVLLNLAMRAVADDLPGTAPEATSPAGRGVHEWIVWILGDTTRRSSTAAAGPPLARAIAARLPADFHPFIGSVMSMTVITSIGVPVLKLLDSAGLV